MYLPGTNLLPTYASTEFLHVPKPISATTYLTLPYCFILSAQLPLLYLIASLPYSSLGGTARLWWSHAVYTMISSN